MKELILNQTRIPKEQWRYGLRSSAKVGCGWIATHNALRLMGYEAPVPDLISYYEKQLPLIHGNAGTSFWGPAVLFRQWGFPVTVSCRPREYDALAAEADACMLFYHWRRGCVLGAHFVALHRTEGGFTGYNTYTTSTGPDRYGESLSAFLKKKKYFGTFLIALKRKP